MKDIEETTQFSDYPIQVIDHLVTIKNIFSRSSINCLLLTGSTARGELTWSQTSQTDIKLMSDYEFIVVSELKPDDDDRLAIMDALHKCESEWQKNSPLFHIDTCWLKASDLPKVAHTFQMFENKIASIVLAGHDLRSSLPEINLKNLDYKELNEILIWRLWAMLLYMPKILLEKNITDETYSYILCRNALDIATWALPHDGVLLPSFKKRMLYIDEYFLSLSTCQAISPNFCSLLNDFSVGKFEMHFSHSTHQLYAMVVELFERATNYLWDLRTTSPNRASFNNWNPRRKGYEAFIMWGGKGGITKGLRWLKQPKYEMQLTCLLGFHQAACAYIGGDENEALQYLNQVRYILENLLPWSPMGFNKTDFVTNWIELRNIFAEFLMQYSRSLGMKRHYIQAILRSI